jgi:phosphoglycerol transferase MdoB-like AlkP superfamily enzyme
MNKWYNIKIIANVYLLALSIFLCFRLLLFYSEYDKAGSDIALILESFWIGERFDIVISGYFLILPFSILSACIIYNKDSKPYQKSLFYFIFILFTVAFLICAVDIPYFNQFFSRFSMNAFQWMDNPVFVFKMIAQEPKYYGVLLPFMLLDGLFYWRLKKILRYETADNDQKKWVKTTVFALVFLLIFIGIRGRVQQKSPIRVGTAYFSDNAFLNQLGLNPVFTLMRSFFDSIDKRNQSITLVDDQEAIANVQQYLHIDKPYDQKSPISRYVNFDTSKTPPYNVVLVIMESMSATKMGRQGNPYGLTPFLDSLSNNCYYFENVYTAGIHTFNGIFSTLHSFPALFNQHPMKEINPVKYNGMANILRGKGYSTTFLLTHDGQFDNVEGFLRGNDFETIISQANYPSAEVKTTLGVPDDYLFRYSIPVINKLHASKKPFFVSFMTGSDHGPFYVPEYFKPKSEDRAFKTVEYADWSLRKFINMASKQKWFDNTVFVFVADHGNPMRIFYDISLDFHHTPFIIYAPKILKENKVFDCIGGQIDVFPTVMGILKQSYVNNTLGIDLLREKRPYIYINDDDKFGVLDKEHLLIVKENSASTLFKYRKFNKKNYKNAYLPLAKDMEKYAKSNMQVFQYISLKNKIKQ